MKRLTITFLFLALTILSIAQVKKATATNKTLTTETKEELFNKLRSKILACGEKISDVNFSTKENELTILYEDKLKLTQFVAYLDPDGISWEIQDQAIKFRITSSTQEYYASKIRLSDLDFFYQAQDDLIAKIPKLKDLAAYSLNKITAAYCIKLL